MKLIKSSKYAMLIIAVSFFGCSSWTNNNIQESQRRGDKVILAINEYFQVHNKYPEKLSDLVPEYIEEVNPPLAGNGRWDYVNEGEGFYLGFWGPHPDNDPVCYKTNKGGWYMDTR